MPRGRGMAPTTFSIMWSTCSKRNAPVFRIVSISDGSRPSKPRTISRRSSAAVGDDEDQSDDQERHADAEEREEDDPDDGEDRADNEQQGARGELLRQVRPSALRIERICQVKTFSSPSTPRSGGGERPRDKMLPRRFDMV